MRLILSAMMIASVASAHAGAVDQIATKAAACWDLPVGTDNFTQASFEVSFDADGYVADATVLDHQASEPRAKLFVMSALRALQKCAPYQDAGTSARVTMDTRDIPPPKAGIDPFKD